jgi:integrase
MSGIHPLWDALPRDAPELQKQAHKLMLQTLRNNRDQLPEVLFNPSGISGARVMEAAMGSTLNPKIPAEWRLAALEMLQARMHEVDPSTPRRRFSIPANQQAAVSATVGDEVEALHEFERALEDYLLDPSARAVWTPPGKRSGEENREEPGKTPSAEAGQTVDDTAQALTHLGLLVAFLVTRLGHGSPALLAHAVQALDEKPWVAGAWAWVDLRLSESGRGVVQRRRLFLDPTTLVAWMHAQGIAARLPKPREGTKPGQRLGFYRKLAQRSFKHLVKAITVPGSRVTIGSLDVLCKAQIQRLRMDSMPLLATFAEGEFSSSSLEIGTWLRLIGYRAPECAEAADSIKKEDAGSEGFLPVAEGPLHGIDQQEDSSAAEQLLEGDHRQDGVIADLRTALSAPRAAWEQELNGLIEKLAAEGEAQATARLVVSWLRHLACERKNKGKMLSSGSVRNYRGLLANRVLENLPPSLTGIDEDELLDAYLEVVMSRRSVQQTGRIMNALASFDGYVRGAHLPDLPRVALPGLEGGAYAISSRILVEEEFAQGLARIGDGTMAFADERLADHTRAFWVLAFRLGLRRKEILGLKARDIDEHLLRIRRNAARGLKTANASRTLPLFALSAHEHALVQRLADGRGLEEFVFFGSDPPTDKMLESHPVIAKINDLLERVTGDRRLHPHNLRHSAATLTLFGALSPDLQLGEHPYLMPWMKAAMKHSAPIESAISGALHRRSGRGSAIATLMGHGSELTTYEHYVHCLDLLLFLDTWHGRYDQGPRHYKGRLGPPRHESAQLLVLLGYSTATRIEMKDPVALLRRIGERYPKAAVLLESTATSTPVRVPGTAAPGLPTRFSLKHLCGLPGAETQDGFPRQQAELDAVAGLLQHLLPIDPAKHPLLTSVVTRWVEAKMRGYDWAAMTSDAASAWIADVCQLSPHLKPEALHVYRERRTGRKVKDKVSRPGEVASYRSAVGRYWVRLADTRSRADTRKSRTDQRRSRLQASLSWTLQMLAQESREN